MKQVKLFYFGRDEVIDSETVAQKEVNKWLKANRSLFIQKISMSSNYEYFRIMIVYDGGK